MVNNIYHVIYGYFMGTLLDIYHNKYLARLSLSVSWVCRM
jgi:hypothetical protein